MAVKDRKIETNCAVLTGVIVLPLGALGNGDEGKVLATLYNDKIWIATAVDLCVATKAAGATAATLDVKDDGVSIFSSLPDACSASAGSKCSGTISGGDHSFSANSKITVNVDSMDGDGSNGVTGATLTIHYRTQGLGEAS